MMRTTEEANLDNRKSAGDGTMRAYDVAGRAFRLIEQYDTPPVPSTYALWYAYASKSNDALVSTIDGILEREGSLSPYVIEHLSKTFLNTDEAEEAQKKISKEFEVELASVLELVQKGVSNNDKFHATLGQIGEGLASSASEDNIGTIISRLMSENKRMAEQSQDLTVGLRETQKQIEKLNSELEEVRNQSMRDPLTSVPNRRAFDLRLADEIRTAAKNGTDLCLVMADIDHFKQVNDSFGHRIGDEVLKIFASIITENIKGQDMAARYGGEEFAVILPRTDILSAYKLIDRIREQFSQTELVFKRSRQVLGKVTSSFGIARFVHGTDPRDMIERADAKLYLAKNNGRNQVQAEELNDIAKAS